MNIQGEYVPECAERMAWLTGFTGSAGVVHWSRRSSSHRVFVDGRYTSRSLKSQVDAGGVSPAAIWSARRRHLWLERPCEKTDSVSVSTPGCIPSAELLRLEKALAEKGLAPSLLLARSQPARSACGKDRPAEPLGSRSRFSRSKSLVEHPCARQKIDNIAEDVKGRQSRMLIRWCSPIHRRLRGYSTSAATMCRTHRIRWPARLSMPMAKRASVCG